MEEDEEEEEERVNPFPNRRPFITATECIIRHASRVLNGHFVSPADKLALLVPLPRRERPLRRPDVPHCRRMRVIDSLVLARFDRIEMVQARR